MAGLITGIAGAVISAGTTAASFIQAGQQKRKQQDFEADAARALADARKKLQVNYAEAMSVNKEPYNQERLAMLSAGAQLAQAAAESRRGVGAAAGQILASQQGVQQDISNRQGIDMQNIQNAILEEESRLRDVNVGLDMQELAGQQQAAADAKLAAQMATQQGIQGIGNTLGLLINENMIPLYGFGKKEAPAAPVSATPPASSGSTAQSTKLVKPEVLSESMFTSPDEAMSVGYTFDSSLGGYVKNPEPSIMGGEAFSSPEQAQSLGYVFDTKSGKYVKSAQSIANPFSVAPTSQGVMGAEAFASPEQAQAFGYIWNDKLGGYVKGI